MEWITDELLFYGGITVAAFSLAAFAISFLVFQLVKMRIKVQLDEEYGKWEMQGQKKGHLRKKS